jgi:hypothetical protein
MLGPARFAHIETTAREVCRAFKIRDEVEDLVRTLTQLDALLAARRAELARLAPSSTPGSGSPSGTDAHLPTKIAVAAAPGAPYPALSKSVPRSPSPTPSTDNVLVVVPLATIPHIVRRPKPKETEYAELLASLDVKKARRLVTSREGALKSVGMLLRRAALTQALAEPGHLEEAPPTDSADPREGAIAPQDVLANPSGVATAETSSSTQSPSSIP